MLITKKIILILKVLKFDQKHQRYGEICKTYKNSQKPAKRQSNRHGCFLKMTGNLILIYITEKIWKSDHKHQRYGEKCKKYKIA